MRSMYGEQQSICHEIFQGLSSPGPEGGAEGQNKEEVDQIICWLTGYDSKGLKEQMDRDVDYGTFFDQAPAMNPDCARIKGVVCGVRVEEIEDPLMKKIRYLDKLVDELARGKALEKIFRS